MENEVSLRLWEKLTRISPDMLCAFDTAGYFVMASEASKSLLGYSSDELVGRHYTDFLHPDYLLLTQEAVEDVLGGLKTNSFENCYIHRDGRCVPLDWSAAWSEEDRVFVCVARDITEVKSSRQKLEESEHRYKALFDNSPDIVYVQDRDGILTDVNHRFLAAAATGKADVVGTHLSTQVSPDMAVVNGKYLAQAFMGNSMRFDYAVEMEGQELVFDHHMHPIYAGSEVIGVQTTARDITPVIRAYEKIRRQSEKLNTIFESITDAFIMLDRDWRLTHINTEAERLVRLDRSAHTGKSIWEVFPDQVGGEFHSRYTEAFDTGKAVHFTSYLKERNVWLQVKASPSPEGMSIYFDDVTALVESRQELEKLSIVASKTLDSVLIMDRYMAIEWANESFTRLTGYTLPEVSGKAPFHFLLGEQTDKAAVRRVLESKEQARPVQEELLVYTKSGEKRWFAIEVTPTFDESGCLDKWIGIQKDITERIASRKELEKLSLVASSTDNGVVITDASGLVEWVNDSFTRITGYTLKEIAGRMLGDVLQGQETDKAALSAVWEKLKQGQPFNTQLINYRKSGERFWASMDITPIIGGSGEVRQFVAIQKDITSWKEAEANLLKLTEDLYRHNSDLQQFTYIVSHNLRAPVANAMGLAGILAKTDKASPQFDRTLSYLRQSVLQLDSLLRDMNTILSIREREADPENDEVELLPVLEQVMTSYQNQLLASGAKIRVDVGKGVTVKANKAYLYSIFHNLLSNALKYRSEERGLEVRVQHLDKSAKGTLLSFSDNGIGFDLKRAGDNVFRLYKRFHSDQRGRGIGLYLVKAHLEAMGGHVEVTSEVGKGTKFLIYLAK